MMLNYGKVYAPVFENFGELSGKAMKLDKKSQCNQACAVECVDTSYLGSGRLDRLFDIDCVNKCGCRFAA